MTTTTHGSEVAALVCGREADRIDYLPLAPVSRVCAVLCFLRVLVWCLSVRPSEPLCITSTVSIPGLELVGGWQLSDVPSV